jgi:cytochrome o ubiquinol oxidase subunit 2
MKTLRTAFIILLLVAIIVLTALYLIIHDIAVLEPDGFIGIRERNLLIDASLLMLLVVIPAVVMCLVFAWIYRASNKKAKYSPHWGESPWAEAIWWCVPFVIVITISIITWKTSIDLNPFRPIDTDKKPLTVQVVALEWKWLFLYPEQEIATINYLQIPIQTPIRFEISADAPMNSFWIPDLGGQIYAMPAMRSILHLFADKEGSFAGHSANISGKGFAGMTFETKASTEEDFNKWVETVKQSTKDLDYKEYLELLKPTMNDPPAFYNLKQDDLFELILKQYTPEGVKVE